MYCDSITDLLRTKSNRHGEAAGLDSAEGGGRQSRILPRVRSQIAVNIASIK